MTDSLQDLFLLFILFVLKCRRKSKEETTQIEQIL